MAIHKYKRLNKTFMKKLLLLAITLTMTLMANAQMSVQLGYLLNTEKSKVTGVKSSSNYSGFMAAADYNLNLTGALSVAPGLGLSYSFDNSDGAKYKEFGLFVPIDFNYRFPVSDALSLSVYAGPTIYYGLISKDTSTDPAYNYYDYDNRRLGLELGGGIWCDIKETVRVKAGYKWGLTNNCKIDGITEKNNCLYLSVGYLF